MRYSHIKRIIIKSPPVPSDFRARFLTCVALTRFMGNCTCKHKPIKKVIDTIFTKITFNWQIIFGKLRV